MSGIILGTYFGNIESFKFYNNAMRCITVLEIRNWIPTVILLGSDLAEI